MFIINNGDEVEIYIVQLKEYYCTGEYVYLDIKTFKRGWAALKGKLTRLKNDSYPYNNAPNQLEMSAFKIEFDHQQNKVVWVQIDYHKA